MSKKFNIALACICLWTLASWPVGAIAPSGGTESLIFIKRNGKEVVFTVGEPVLCITRQAPRRQVRGTIEEITDTYIQISGDRVPLEDIDRMEIRGTRWDDITTALLFGSLGFLAIGFMISIGIALAGNSGGGGVLAFLAIVFLGTLIAKIIRSFAIKK